jgi:organic radical activating enzyme
MNWNIIKLYGKTLLLRRGVTLNIFLDYKCTLSCEYCCLKLPSGHYPNLETSTLDEWEEFINRWPTKIKEVTISGGEPAMISYLPDLANWLLEKGYHVKVFSNLTIPEPFEKIKNNYRFIITSTYHRGFKQDKYLENYLKIKQRIDVHEIGIKTLPFSKLKPMITDERDIERESFRINPKRQIFIGCYDLLK